MKRVLSAAMAIIAALSLQAAPMNGAEFSFKQPDGSRVPVKVFGDEFHQSVESPDGYTLIRNDDGWICYAALSNDSASLLATKRVFDGQASRSSGQKHLRINGDAQLAAREAMRKELGLPSYEEEMRAFESREIMEPVRATDTIVGLTVLIDFPDKKSSIGRNEVTNLVNQKGYSNYGNNGSVRDYYWDASAGKLVYINVVTQFYTSKYNKGYYDVSTGWGKAGDLITESLNHLKRTGFDFSQITGKNGNFQCLNFFYAGKPDHGWSKGLWPHMSTYQGNFMADGKYARQYQFTNIGSALDNYTFIHENGHMLCGYPDLYSYQTGHKGGMNGMCAMSTNQPKNPIMFNPYFRSLMGWMDITKLSSSSAGQQFEDPANDNTCFVYDGSSTEKFFIETRRRRHRSAELAGEGLMIWHVNEKGSNTKSSNFGLLVALEQADGKKTLEGGGWGNATDWFYKGNNDSFSDYTSPNAKLKSGSSSGLDIRNISAISDAMTFSFGEFNPSTDTIGVLSPSGGEQYVTGDTIAIQWEDNFDGAVSVALTEGSTVVKSISNSTTKQTDNWVIPPSIQSGTYTVTVTSVDNSAVKDKSGSFTITFQEDLDTSGLALDLMQLAGVGRETNGDADGSTISLDTTGGKADVSIGLTTENATAKIYPWAKYYCWIAPEDLRDMTIFKVRYSATDTLYCFLEDTTLSNQGKEYFAVLPPSRNATERYLTTANFVQPKWVDPKDDLSLMRTTGIAFGTKKSGASLNFTIEEVTTFGFLGFPEAVLNSANVAAATPIISGAALAIPATLNAKRVEILAPNGRIVHQRELSGSATINLAEVGLAKGLYLYRIKTNVGSVQGVVLNK